MNEKPTLHDIAAMPYPTSMLAMRKYYNPEWGMPVPDGATKMTFKVEVEYSYSVHATDTVEVEAFSDEEAEEKAGDVIAERHPWDAEVDVRNTKIEARTDA